MRPFEPLIRNPHLLTILSNFWPRDFDFSRYPKRQDLYQTDPATRVLVQSQSPAKPQGEAVLLHGLEGGGDAGYIRSMAWRLLEAGFTVHRFHMRTCGGTERYCETLYHGGLTSDLRSFLEQRNAQLPVFLIGFSLGGNVCLKLAGELGETDLIQGVCAISTPIDLGACSRRIGQRDNRLYENRFLKRMRARVLATGRFDSAAVLAPKSLYDIDDKITAPSFGFRDAEHYYGTQSAKEFLAQIRVSTLLIQAKDDTFIPFEIFDIPAIRNNPHIRLIATSHGGHLGFLSKRVPRFWVDEVAVEFLSGQLASNPALHATID